jgi:predicted extracellular nuclease
VRNVPINVVSQDANNYGILSQRASGSRKPMEGASRSGIPPQAARNSSKPMAGGELKIVASNVGRLHLEKTKLSASARREPKLG